MYVQHSASRTSNNIHPAQLDQAEFLKDEVFDNHIPVVPPGGPGTSSGSHIPTPSSTPTAQRKNRRISNLFVSGHRHAASKISSTVLKKFVPQSFRAFFLKQPDVKY